MIHINQMNALPLALGGFGIALLLSTARRKNTLPSRAIVRPTLPRQTSEQVVTMISREAKRQGVPSWVALTFAELESGLNPLAFGDRNWAAKHPKQWQALRARMPNNPGIAEPGLWGAYGLFQLLAAYHVRENEHPTVLFDPIINARRGIAAIARALRKTGGDVAKARRIYVCGPEMRCSAEKLAKIDSRLIKTAQRWLA